MKLSPLAKAEWITAFLTGAMLTFGVIALGFGWLALITVPLTVFIITFFRDPDRSPPTQRGVVVAPADGRVVSVHDVDRFAPFNDDAAVCIRIFLSVFNVHVQRTPCHGRVQSISHKAGKHISVLNPASVEQNESVLMVLQHPVKDHPIAAVRQIAGSFARTIVCAAKEDEVLQRAQRFGLIKLGSTVELYLPKDAVTRIGIGKGQKTVAGVTVLAEVTQTATNTTPVAEKPATETEVDAPPTAPNQNETEPADLRWEETADAESQPIPDDADPDQTPEAMASDPSRKDLDLNKTDLNTASIDSDANASTPTDSHNETESGEARSEQADDEYEVEATEEDETEWEYEEVEESPDDHLLEEEEEEEEEGDEETEYIYVDEDGNEIVDEDIDDEEDMELALDTSESEPEEADDLASEEAASQTKPDAQNTASTPTLSSTKSAKKTGTPDTPTNPKDSPASGSTQPQTKPHGPLFANSTKRSSTKKQK